MLQKKRYLIIELFVFLKKVKKMKNKKKKQKTQSDNIKNERSYNKDQNAQSPVIVCNTFDCPYAPHHEPDPCSMCPYKPIQFEKKNRKKDLDYYVAYYGDCLPGLLFLILLLFLVVIPIAKDENSLLYAYIHHIPLK